MPKARSSKMRVLVKAVIYLCVAWLLGFGLYFIQLPKNSAKDERADAIVVLTGGAGRLEEGLALLEHGAAKRMLISGVNPVVKSDELSALTGTEQALFNCCVDLGKAALNTEGNALETAEWTLENKVGTLILVTADYHMPRTLILFEAAMPDVMIIAHPVSGEWPLLFLAKEYSKYIVTLVRHAAYS